MVYGYVFIDTVGWLVKLPPSNRSLTVEIEGSIRRGEHHGQLEMIKVNCLQVSTLLTRGTDIGLHSVWVIIRLIFLPRGHGNEFGNLKFQV